MEKNHSGTGFGCIEVKPLELRHQAKFRKQMDNFQKIFPAYIKFIILDELMKNIKINKRHGKISKESTKC